MSRLLVFLISILFAVPVFTQPVFPDNGELFVDDVIPRIDITVNPDTLEWIFENVESYIEFSASFVFDNGNIRDTIYPVGFRLRGNTSRYSQKKSFKISFNRFTPGGSYYGVEKLNLNGEHNDPSVIRSKVCWDVLRKMEIPAPRSNHVKVYINGDYFGLYINVEHIDEEFVKSRYSYNDGNLYKCLWPANLNYLGSNPDAYKLSQGDRRVYDLKTNTEADDYTDIANFIDILNNTSQANLKCELDEIFNVYDYLKVIAADILFGNWDGYIYNQNNFYLYQNTSTGKMEYIPYDLDNTIGIDWLNRDWGTRNIYDWAQHGDNYRPLYERLMDNPEFRNQYTYYIKMLVTSTIDLDSLISSIEDRRDMIAPSLMSDPFYPLDYGYTMNDFYNSFYQPLGGHVDYGLFTYLTTRYNAIMDQLENTQMLPVIKYIKHQRSSSTQVWVNAFVDVENQPAIVELHYRYNSGVLLEKSLYDDGNHGDGQAGDHIYGGSIENIPVDATVSYQVFVSDSEAKENLLPCNAVVIPPAGNGDAQLFINEFMASNNETIADEHGDYDDWIEIYNPGNDAVWLGNKFLTDNLNNPTKWQMPDAYIGAGEFLIIWADGEPEQGIYHASFKLDKNGEEIGIFDDEEVSIDEYVFSTQTTDISEGRLPNGGISWVFFEKPTPGASNEVNDIGDIDDTKGIKLFPNPAKGSYVYLSEECSFSVYSITGQLIEKQEFSHLINIQEYNNGIYFVVIDNGQILKMIIQ